MTTAPRVNSEKSLVCENVHSHSNFHEELVLPASLRRIGSSESLSVSTVSTTESFLHGDCLISMWTSDPNAEALLPFQCKCARRNDPYRNLKAWMRSIYRYERFTVFSVLLALDALLSLIILVPVRFVLAIYLGMRKRSLEPSHLLAIFEATLLLSVVSILFLVSDDQISEFVKNFVSTSDLGASVMFNILDVVDRVVSVLGLELVQYLFFCANHYSRGETKRLFLFSLPLLLFQAAVAYLQVIVFTLAVSSKKDLVYIAAGMQITLVNRNLFKISKEVEWAQMCVDDVKIRMRWIMFAIILIKNYCISAHSLLSPDLSLLYSNVFIPCVILFTGELLAQWVKHFSIIMANNFESAVLSKFATDFSAAYLVASDGWSSMKGSKLLKFSVQHMKFSPLCLACVLWRGIFTPVMNIGWARILPVYLAIVLLKLTYTHILRRFAKPPRKKKAGKGPPQNPKKSVKTIPDVDPSIAAKKENGNSNLRKRMARHSVVAEMTVPAMQILHRIPTSTFESPVPQTHSHPQTPIEIELLSTRRSLVSLTRKSKET